MFGFGENAREAFAALKSERWLGYQVVGFVAPCADVRDAENLDDQPICGKPLLPYLLEEPPALSGTFSPASHSDCAGNRTTGRATTAGAALQHCWRRRQHLLPRR